MSCIERQLVAARSQHHRHRRCRCCGLRHHRSCCGPAATVTEAAKTAIKRQRADTDVLERTQATGRSSASALGDYRINVADNSTSDLYSLRPAVIQKLRTQPLSDSRTFALAALLSVALFGAIVGSAAPAQPNNRSTDAPAWANPCRGVFVQRNGNSPKEPTKKPQIYCELYGNLTRYLYIKSVPIMAGNTQLNSSNWTKAISRKYSFLPVPKKPGITLITWHRQAQMYLAAVIALQRRYSSHQRPASAASRHLKTFRSDMREVLCKLEHAVNLTESLRPEPRSIRIIGDAAMAKRLPFATQPPAAADGVNHFVLFALQRRWTKFLRTTLKILRKHTRLFGECLRPKRKRTRMQQQRRRFLAVKRSTQR